ncbi:DUF1294 domain-containing protein [Candidatus Viridilinea mediisalina]|uniref:Probable zinc-binding domain-containing protein n=1 Tax=Candidatus Viridilinea mediisalina TaxID=2024553 RepID=A0A2A6RFP9_9CHLR|nr:DUF1294 domain-containing protein [Candidatus Viridilinea mediisalina]PDW01708.1 hypothetical protein CJ255_17780 [Candidatus Viridilinea mediisalina]
MPDQQLVCKECGQVFTWAVGEQAFYRERGLQPPRRCVGCRAQRRQVVAAEHGASPLPRRSTSEALPVARRRRRRSRGGAWGWLVGMTLALSLGAALWFAVSPWWAWWGAINGVALLVYSYDKLIAGGTQRRVPEAVLLSLALLGGSAGALVAMVSLRHKTSKPTFYLPFALIVLIHLGAIWWWPW